MIQPVDNSDLSWLIFADYMEDNNLPYAQKLRDSIVNPTTALWEFQYIYRFIGSGGVGGGVGGGD